MRNDIYLEPAFIIMGVRANDGSVQVFTARGPARDQGDIIDATVSDESEYDDIGSYSGILTRVRTRHEYELRVRLTKFTVNTGTSFGSVFSTLFGAWTAARTWVAGEIVTASRLNHAIRDGVNRLKGNSIA